VTQHFQIVIPGGANNVRSSFFNTWTLGLEAGKRVLSDINVKLDELDLNVARPASALARNYPTLLAKSDPPPRPVGWCFAAGQERGFAAGQERSFAARQLLRAGLSLSTPAVESPAPADSFSCDLSALRALGADDVKPPRTPAAWMILLLSLSHQHTRLRRG
jgi:hypothetical protein